MLTIREATDADWSTLWALFRQVAGAGDAFAFDADTPELVARKIWIEAPARPYVAVRNGRVLGTYYVRPNQPGRGPHVANAGSPLASDMKLIDTDARFVSERFGWE